MIGQSREQSRGRFNAKLPVVRTFPVPNSDVGLVAALRADHPGAVRVLCERYSGELQEVAKAILGPDADVDPFVIGSLRWSLSHLEDLGDPRSLRVWLLSRLVVLAGRRLRVRRSLSWFRHANANGGVGGVHCSEQLASTYRVLDRLGVRGRVVFCLVVIHSMGLNDAALVLGTSSSAVRGQLTSVHAQFGRLARSNASHLARRHSSHASLGREVASELGQMLGCGQIFEFDLLQSEDRMRWRCLLRSRRLAWVLALAPLLLVLATALGAWFIYFRAVEFRVNGEVAGSTTSNRLGRWVVAPRQRSETVSFSDGSNISLAPGTRLRVLSTSYRGSACVLDSGATRLSIFGSGRTEYLIAAGPFVLLVAKGQAEFSWDSENALLGITVHQGKVVLSGCQFGAGSSLITGMSLHAQCPAQPSEP